MKTNTPRTGAVSVEMAITAPILFLVLFASLEFCGMNNLRHTVDNAAYEGARRGIVPGATAAAVRQEALANMASIGAQNVRVTVAPDPILQETDQITVNVFVPVSGNGWLAPIYFRGTNELVGRCTMNREDY